MKTIFNKIWEDGTIFFDLLYEMAEICYKKTGTIEFKRINQAFGKLNQSIDEWIKINNVCGTSYEPEEYHILMNHQLTSYLEKGGKFIDIMRARLAFILTNIHNFTRDVS